MIRGAAKNFHDVLIVSSRTQYNDVFDLLSAKNCETDLEDRKKYSKLAFATSSHYDSAIHAFFAGIDDGGNFRASQQTPLRYGENPHQSATFYGNLGEMFMQLHGKELSYNNLMDVDACVKLMMSLTSRPL